MKLRRVDPAAADHGLLRRALHQAARSKPGRWYGINVAAPVDAFLLRRTGGRIRLVGALPTALLTTTGARSGLPREAPVLYFHDGDDVILIASSFGRDRHPAWYHNIRTHPEVTLNGHRFLGEEVADAKEGERLYGLAVQLYPGYADYRVRTATVGRRIPVLRLTPR
jgi:deazaflavin-dependent oxidoreductase (nitroreductase family)